MKIMHLEPSSWERFKKNIILFVKKHGDGRITHKAIRWLNTLQEEDFNKKGNVLLLAVSEGKIAGFLAISDYGREESIVIVHKEERQKRLGVDLIREYLTVADKGYGRVALDNIPSLKMCFAMGMVGFKLIEGPTGKPTLWLGLGNWKKEDVE